MASEPDTGDAAGGEGRAGFARSLVADPAYGPLNGPLLTLTAWPAARSARE